MHLDGKPHCKLFTSETHSAAQLRTEVAETATQQQVRLKSSHQFPPIFTIFFPINFCFRVTEISVYFFYSTDFRCTISVHGKT